MNLRVIQQAKTILDVKILPSCLPTHPLDIAGYWNVWSSARMSTVRGITVMRLIVFSFFFVPHHRVSPLRSTFVVHCEVNSA